MRMNRRSRRRESPVSDVPEASAVALGHAKLAYEMMQNQLNMFSALCFAGRYEEAEKFREDAKTCLDAVMDNVATAYRRVK